MSAIGGMHRFDGAMLCWESFRVLEQALERRDGSCGATAVRNSTVMAFRGVVTNQESAHELQPVVSLGGEMLVWDGRLDNRQDLISDCREELCRLQLAGLVPQGAPRRFSVSPAGEALTPRD